MYLGAAHQGGAATIFRPDPAHDDRPDSVELPGLQLDELVRRITAFRDAAAGWVSNDVEGRGFEDHVVGLLQWVGEIVWEPVLRRWPWLHGTRVAVVPIGEVAQLPLFTALFEERPLCAQLDLTVAPSSRSLILAAMADQRDGPVLVAADPSPDHGEIASSLDEVTAVAAAYGVPARVLKAPDADLIADIRSASVVHLACHGLLDTAEPLDSALRLGEPVSVRILLAEDLMPGSLLVLSACDLANIGSAAPAEQLGFPAALLASGARSVVAAHWPVPDNRRTVRFMTEFHRELARVTPPAALGTTVGRAHEAGTSAVLWGAFAHFGA